MAHQLVVVSRTIKNAFQNKRAAEELLTNPAAVFRNNGLDIPEGQDENFNSYFEDVARDIVDALRQSDESQLAVAHSQVLVGGFWCKCCQIGAWGLALTITGIGVAGLAALTQGSAVVVALAELFGVGTRAALLFIQGLGAAVTEGVNAVVLEICRWIGACK